MNSYATARRRRRTQPWFRKTRRTRGTGIGWWILMVATGYFKAKAEGKKFNPYGPQPRKSKTSKSGSPRSGSGVGGGSGRSGRPVDGPKTERPTPKPPKDDAVTPIDEGYDPKWRGSGADDPIDDAEIVDPDDEEYVHNGEVIDDDEPGDEELPIVDEDGNGLLEITDNYSWVE